MRKLTAPDYRVMAWKNGGGTTTELHLEPGGDGAFLWRASIATVIADGPFSLFPGYDRHIMTIEGAGMLLDGGPDGPIDVTAPFSPRSFSGDWPIISRLAGGPLRDFNLMARRSALRSSLTVTDLTEPLRFEGADGETVLIHLLTGTAMIGTLRLDVHDSALLSEGETATVVPLEAGPPSRLAICRLGLATAQESSTTASSASFAAAASCRKRSTSSGGADTWFASENAS